MHGKLFRRKENGRSLVILSQYCCKRFYPNTELIAFFEMPIFLVVSSTKFIWMWKRSVSKRSGRADTEDTVEELEIPGGPV